MFLHSRLAVTRISFLSGSPRSRWSYHAAQHRAYYLASNTTTHSSDIDVHIEMMEEIDLSFVEEPFGSNRDSSNILRGPGYIQVNFHDKIGPESRYEVLRKLGWGRHVRGDLCTFCLTWITNVEQSTVWLARDLKYAPVLYVFFTLLTLVKLV